VFVRHFPGLVRALTVVSGNREVAADCVQEAFVRAHLRWDRVSHLDQPVAWIRRVALNLARDQHRRHTRGERAHLRLVSDYELETEAPEPASDLTVAGRKRLELARALASQPTLLLLDEVAGGLVEHECAELIALIKDVRKQGVAIVWIEHIVHALVAVVDRVVVLHGGRFIAEGDPAEVIKSPQVAEIYMGIPTEA